MNLLRQEGDVMNETGSDELKDDEILDCAVCGSLYKAVDLHPIQTSCLQWWVCVGCEAEITDAITVLIQNRNRNRIRF